jgi:hypothetical protein
MSIETGINVGPRCPDIGGEDILEIHRRAALARIARENAGRIAIYKSNEDQNTQFENMTQNVQQPKEPYFVH